MDFCIVDFCSCVQHKWNEWTCKPCDCCQHCICLLFTLSSCSADPEDSFWYITRRGTSASKSKHDKSKSLNLICKWDQGRCYSNNRCKQGHRNLRGNRGNCPCCLSSTGAIPFLWNDWKKLILSSFDQSSRKNEWKHWLFE